MSARLNKPQYLNRALHQALSLDRACVRQLLEVYLFASLRCKSLIALDRSQANADPQQSGREVGHYDERTPLMRAVLTGDSHSNVALLLDHRVRDLDLRH